MPRRKGRGKKKGRKSRKGKVLKISNHQASTKKYDSKVEKIIARVARQEDQKAKEKLIFRQYLFGPYSPTTNVFLGGLILDFGGVVAPLAQVQKHDISTAVTIIPQPNPVQNPSTWVSPGTNVLAMQKSYDGFRRGMWIKIHGISVGIRCHLNALSAVAEPLMDSVDVHWKVFQSMYTGSEFTDSKPDLMESGCMAPRFGFSTKLDIAAFGDTKNRKNRTVYRDKFTMRVDQLRSDTKFKFKYIDLSNRPLLVQYNNLDQSGRQVLRWKPFIAFQATAPIGNASVSYKPIINCFTKIHYTDT